MAVIFDDRLPVGLSILENSIIDRFESFVLAGENAKQSKDEERAKGHASTGRNIPKPKR
jgi:hypothetical protein